MTVGTKVSRQYLLLKVLSLLGGFCPQLRTCELGPPSIPSHVPLPLGTYAHVTQSRVINSLMGWNAQGRHPWTFPDIDSAWTCATLDVTGSHPGSLLVCL
eukprot:jgi/Mesvir1/5700/Mv25572-RA.1